MSIVKLTQSFIDNDLRCPEGKTRVEYCDSDLPGFMLEVRAASPGQGTYWIRYKNANGKTSYAKVGKTTGLDAGSARKKAKDIKATITLGADPAGAERMARKDALKFSELFEDHYIPYVKPRKRSWERDEELYRLRIKKVFGDKRLNQITRQQLQSFHTELLAEGLAPASCDHHLKLLKHVLYLAIDWGLLTEKNPAARIPLYNVDNKVDDHLSNDELQRLLAVLQTDKNRPVCLIAMFALSTGCRINEALSATHSQIDLRNRTWVIPSESSKSKRSRMVPLSESAIEILTQAEKSETSEFIFFNKKSGTRYTTIFKVWQRIRKAAGLPKLRLHGLRHTYSRCVLDSGSSLALLQKLLGHQSSAVTQRYAHMSDESLHAAANGASVIIKTAMQPAT